MTGSLTGGSVATLGRLAHGLLLQSIGGGGTAGSAYSTTVGGDFAVAIAIGGSGGAGGSGGTATLGLSGLSLATGQGTAAGVNTNPVDAYSIHAQSIGGGGGLGGSASAQAIAVALPFPPDGRNPAASFATAIGGAGGAAGDGGNLSLVLNGTASTIATQGQGSHAILLQSVGGGGGAGGDSSAMATTIRYGRAASVAEGTSISLNVGVALGGAGSSGGRGGTITASLDSAAITTYGDYANALLAQSVGGGGGNGGIGSSTTANFCITNTAAISLGLGGTGGAGGAAGSVTLTINPQAVIQTYGASAMGVVGQSIGGGGGTSPGGTLHLGLSGETSPGEPNLGEYSRAGGITTQGDWSHGLVAQSIGAGGGIGGAATAASSGASYSATVALGGSGGVGGNGGAVSLDFGAASRIATGLAGGTGYAAFGVLAQSIGGGLAADGSAGSTGTHNLGGTGRTGRAGEGGDGGGVTISGAANIVTRGDVAVGLLLQSIGGGGGVSGSGASTANPSPGPATFMRLGSVNGAAGSGGAVLIDNAGVIINTSGAHVHAVLAQSIGGGGGFGFVPSAAQPATSGTTNNLGATQSAFVGNGGAVTLQIASGAITTGGLAAHGIVAQSIGGGIFAQGSQNHAGTTNGGAGSGSGGAFSITHHSRVHALGPNAIGIFAQSLGPTANPSDTTEAKITVNGSVQGGSGSQGIGIWTDVIGRPTQILVTSVGSVSAVSGLAIRMTGSDDTRVVNNNGGSVTGSYDLDGGIFNNNGTLNGGPSLAAGQLVNTGDVVIGHHTAFGVSAVSGSFMQRSGGRLLLDADFSNRRSDVMTVAGAADLAGRVRPLISSVLPNVELPFLAVNGPVKGSLEGDRSSVFSYDVNRKGGAFTVSARADFTPPGYALSRNISAVANHMQAAWDAGGSGLGPLLTLLGNTADVGARAPTAPRCGRSRPMAAWRPARWVSRMRR